MKSSMLIVNPSSGKEKGTEYAKQALQVLEGTRYQVEVRLTTGEGDAMNFAREACDHKFDVVVAMGGDGTINEAINGIAEQKHRPVLGVIPLGTVNDFARALSIPLDPEDAIDLISHQQTRKVDVGKINDKYFMNITAVGALAEASFAVSAEQKTKLGPLAYIVEGLKTMKEKQPFDLQINCEDGEGEWSGDALLMLIALTNSIGGFESLAPEAEVNDGKLHVFIIKDIAFHQFLSLLPKIVSGDLGESKHVEYLKVGAITAFSSLDMTSNIDGDEGDRLPITVKNLSRHLEVFVQPEVKE
ncbi:diacylglycerol/lipid kinase family protein [Metabacillus arenae]|uniref:Diacylglycerol kinase family lipid kinase n=1 Tax=Metabacillus arenae TaxID=2771434 RepID=A0A926NFB6_9BACI|nr:diacylglycerol kinase family protein [Metabacillus arenae]MBD1380514.1 diacylglycerol kinase family lipid kinase [Metabacillus arenae]